MLAPNERWMMLVFAIAPLYVGLELEDSILVWYHSGYLLLLILVGRMILKVYNLPSEKCTRLKFFFFSTVIPGHNNLG